MGSSCCAKDKNANNPENNLPIDSNGENQLDEKITKPNPLQRPSGSDAETVFLEKAASLRSPNPEVMVPRFIEEQFLKTLKRKL